MPKFNFRLQPLVKLREAERDRCRQELASAYQAEQILTERQEALNQEIEQARKISRSKSQPGSIEVDGLLDTHRYELVLRTQIRHMEAQREKLDVEIERRRQDLVAADSELRILEKLRERQKRELQREQEKLAIRRLDEMALRPRPGLQKGDRP